VIDWIRNYTKNIKKVSLQLLRFEAASDILG